MTMKDNSLARVEKMRADAYPNQQGRTVGQYMRGVAERVMILNGTVIRTGTTADFIEDMTKAGFIKGKTP